MRRSAASSALAALAALGACAGSGETPRRGDPLAAAQRVANVEFGAARLGRSQRRIEQTAAALAAEPQRVAGVPTTAARLVRGDDARIDRLGERSAGLARTEAGRPAQAQATAGREASDEARRLDALADHGADWPWFLWLHRQPLPEPTDPQHRTDPHDTRPVPGLWARLRRRLGL